MAKLEKQKGINQFVLRLIGIAATCVCSAGYAFGFDTLTIAGWIAYPIFAYMLVDGFYHTISRKKYALRILVFAAVSELFYDLLLHGEIDMSGQNPLFTLLVGYLAVWGLDWVRNRYDNYFVTLVAVAVFVYAGNLLCRILCTSYAAFGVFFVILFYLAENVSYPVLLEVISIIYLSFSLSTDAIATVSVLGIQYELCTQLSALISLIFIHIYNGSRGRNGFGLKILFYILYPAQLLVFYVLSLVI